MYDINIFVEGIADLKFLQDYIKVKFKRELEKQKEIKYLGTNALGELKKAIPIFRKNTSLWIRNVIIFDANGDFQNKINNLNVFTINNSLDLDIFLLPNNSEIGNLEDLLEKIINPQNQKIFDCFEKYQECLKSEERFFIPIKKTKIYAYADTLITDRNNSKMAKEENRNYSDNNNWDLDDDILNPLYEFLKKYFE
jgi:hypothetical protein